jgi:hypothetical protein
MVLKEWFETISNRRAMLVKGQDSAERIGVVEPTGTFPKGRGVEALTVQQREMKSLSHASAVALGPLAVPRTALLFCQYDKRSSLMNATPKVQHL